MPASMTLSWAGLVRIPGKCGKFRLGFAKRTHLGGHYGKSKLGIAKNRARGALGEGSNYAEAPIFYFPTQTNQAHPTQSIH